MLARRPTVDPVRIIISGSSGLIGSMLVSRLLDGGHDVVRLVRGDGDAAGQRGGASTAPWEPSRGQLDAGVIDGSDAVINLSGAGIGDHRWTDSYKTTLLESRTGPTATLARAIAAVDRKPGVFLSASGIGIYGPSDDREVDETSPPGGTFLADVCRQWEAATAPAEEAGVRTVHLRSGVVLSPAGGALKKQLPLFKLGLGGRFGSGRQWQSWIARPDEVGAIQHLLTADVAGPVNLTSPRPVTNREMTAALGRVLKRPTVVPIPAFGPRLLLGRELADELLFSGQRVLPRVLQASGYTFRLPELEAALRALLHEGADVT